MSNKSNGTAFEKIFSVMLSKKGFWVHRIQDNCNGQPFDVIAARNGKTYVFDCKDCSRDSFRLDRIEENQRSAMALWSGCGNREGLFALRFNDEEIYVVEYKIMLDMLDAGKRKLARINVQDYGIKFDDWVRRA